MSSGLLTAQIGQRILLPGHFDTPVVLEDARSLGPGDSAGYECRVRLPDGSLEEAVVSAEEVTAIIDKGIAAAGTVIPVDAEKLRLLVESARIRLAYAHDQQFAVSLSGIRTLPHQIEAVYQAMLPQPRLRFLLADDPGAGKTIMAGLLVKEMKLREAIERILILCPAPLTIQWQDVHAFNFVATDSEDGQPIVEGRILLRLLEKLDQMNQALEGRVFDVIGEVLSLNDVNLPDMLREAAYDPRRLDEYLDQIDRIEPAKLKEYEEATGIALARNHVDFSAFQRRNLEIEERRLMPRYVEAQFVGAAREVGLRIEPRADGLWRIEHVLAELRSERLHSVQKLGKADTSYRKFTFHKRHLEQDAHLDAVLMGPGHPLYAAVDEKLNERLAPLVGGVGFFVDSLCKDPYRIHLFEISIRGKDTRGNDIPLHGELVAVREEHGHYEVIPNDVLFNLAAHPHPPQEIEPVSVQAAADHLKRTYQIECRTRCQEERQHFARVCREYLEKSFKARIDRAQERAMMLAAEAFSKPEYRLTADEARKYVDDLQRTRQERLDGRNRLAIARTGPVKHLATAVIPGLDADTQPHLADLAEIDPNVRGQSEIAAEDRVVEALVAEGFPKDRIERVGHLKLGFDIRAHRIVDEATGEVSVKRVEVKGRLRGQPIRLTTNEWYKAQQLAETYWLYVVWNPLGASPELVRIHNPTVSLDHAKREIVAARFYEIPADAVQQAASGKAARNRRRYPRAGVCHRRNGTGAPTAPRSRRPIRLL